MNRPLDIIPELANAVYSITSEPAFYNNGVLYVVRNYVLDRNGLRMLVATHQGNLVIHSLTIYDSYYSQSRGGEQYIIRYAIIDPSRVATSVKFHITK